MRPIGKSCHRKGGLLGRFWNGSAADCCRATVSETNPSLFVHSNLSPFPLYLSSLGLSQICVNRAGRRVPIKDSRLSEFDILFGRGWNVILLRIAPHESNGWARTIVQRPKADRPFRCHVLTCISHLVASENRVRLFFHDRLVGRCRHPPCRSTQLRIKTPPARRR